AIVARELLGPKRLLRNSRGIECFSELRGAASAFGNPGCEAVLVEERLMLVVDRLEQGVVELFEVSHGLERIVRAHELPPWASPEGHRDAHEHGIVRQRL